MTEFFIGQEYKKTFVISSDDVNEFAKFSGDYNPLHIDSNFAKSLGYSRPVVHGVIQLSYLSKIIGMDFPGHGALWFNQTVNWLSPVFIGDSITFILKVLRYSSTGRILELSVDIFNQHKTKVMEGVSKVKLSTQISFSDCETRVSNTNDEAVDSRGSKAALQKDDQMVALVTGASRGLGADIAKQLANAGYKVVINYIYDDHSARELLDEVNQLGQNGKIVKADVSSSKQTSKMFSEIFSEWGRCDIVIHGATPSLQYKNVADVLGGDIERYMSVYLGGGINVVKESLPLMKQNKFGRFIFIGSSAMFGMPPKGLAGYVVAKQALWGYTKSLSSEVGALGITANMVSPSMMVTDLTADLSPRIKELEAVKSPIRRLISTDEVAYQILHLCRDESSGINGVNFPITGGPVC